jgi:hypothetical protein
MTPTDHDDRRKDSVGDGLKAVPYTMTLKAVPYTMTRSFNQ